MADGDSSDKRDPKDEEDFDFASFLDEKGEGGPPPSGSHAVPSDMEEDDFASFLGEGKKNEPTPTGGEASAELSEGDDDFASFLDESGEKEPTAQSASDIGDEDDLASFLEGEKASTPSSGPASGDDFEEFLRAEDTAPTNAKTGAGLDEPTDVIEAYRGQEHLEESSLPTMAEMPRVEPPQDTEDTFAIAEDAEEIEIEEEPETAPSRSRRSLVSTLGLVFVGCAIGGIIGWGYMKTFEVDRLNLALGDEKMAAGAARLQVKHTQDMLQGVRDENDRYSKELESLKEDLQAAKRESFEAKKELIAAKREVRSAAASTQQLTKAQEENAQLKAQLSEATAAAEAAQKAQAEAQAAAEEALAKAEATPAGDAATTAASQQQIEEAEKNLTAANEKVAELTATIEGLQAQLAERESAQPNPAPAANDDALTAARAEIASLEAKVKELEQAPPAAPAATADDKEALAAANSKIAELEGQIEELQARPAQATASSAEDASDELREDLEKSKQELAAANAERDALKGQLAAVSKELTEAKQSSASLYLPPKSDAANLGLSLQSYHQGIHDYFLGDYQAAEASFEAAVERYPRDARYHFFLALARHRLGENDKAAEDARRGWALEEQELPTAYEISQALERIQGGDRRWLSSQRN